MKRLILEMGSGADLYGMDYTKAALIAFNDAIRHSSIILFRSLDLDHCVMNVNVTIGVQDPEQVDVDRLMAEVPRGNPNINVVLAVIISRQHQVKVQPLLRPAQSKPLFQI